MIFFNINSREEFINPKDSCLFLEKSEICQSLDLKEVEKRIKKEI